MATLQSATMQDWKTLFPDFATLEGSCLFIKKLIAVSVSSITYIRGIFPEQAYGERNIGGLKLKLLTEDCGIKAVSKFIDIIRSCYDAVEKRYLQQMSIGIGSNQTDRNEVMEAYNLVFSYKDDECSITCQGGRSTYSSPKLTDPTVMASLKMLKSITAIDSLLGMLPQQTYISVKLLYYDNVTPPDYEPPGFQPSDKVKFSFTGKTMNIELGKVDTEQHGYKFLLKSTMCNQSSSLSNCSEQTHLAPSQCSKTKREILSEELIEDDLASEPVTTKKALKKNNVGSNLSCPCNCKSIDEAEVIHCVSCERPQHKACYGILKDEDIPEVFYCFECMLHNTDGTAVLDSVYTLQGRQRQVFCCVRRFFALNEDLEFVSPPILEKMLGCNKLLSRALLQKLGSEGFLEKVSGKEKYAINQSHIVCYGLPEYFNTNGDKENESIDYENENVETDELPPQMYSPMQKASSTQDYDAQTATLEDICNIESSIRQVKKLNISKMSTRGVATSGGNTEKEIRKSRKRKASGKNVSYDDSDELFQSQKRSRNKKKKA